MDRYLTLELNSWGISFSTAQFDFYLSWLGLLIATLSVVGYRIAKKYKKGRK